MTSASEEYVDVSMMDTEHNEAGDRSDTASSSSSFSVITLKESPIEADFHGRLSSLPETAAVYTAQVQTLDSSESQQQLNSIKCPPDGTSFPSVQALSATTTQAAADTLLTDLCDTGVVCGKGVTIFVFVDHLERRITLKNKPKLKITELTAEMFSYSPSFHRLPAIVESLRSDDAPLSDASMASGEGYVADGGHLRSESCLSNASSPASSLSNVAVLAECDDFHLLPDQHRLSGVSDDFDVSYDKTYTEHRLHLQCPSSSSEKTDTVVSDRQQLSAKSSSDGVDSAVVCTPYSTQTSQDSTDTVDNAHGRCCHLIGDIVDDQAPQPLPSAAVEVRPVVWENDKRASVSRTAGEAARCESSGEDYDDKMSVTSLKVDWEVGSDSETPMQSEANVISAQLIEPPMHFVHRPFPSAVCSVHSLEEQARELERRWSNKPAARRACCACLSSVIVHHRVSTAADVTPTISIRLCSSVVDVICLIQRLIAVSSTWLQVVCNSAFSLQHFGHSQDEQLSQETAIMCPASVDHAASNTGIVCESGIDNDISVNAGVQHRSMSEGLENVRESRLRQLISVSVV